MTYLEEIIRRQNKIALGFAGKTALLSEYSQVFPQNERPGDAEQNGTLTDVHPTAAAEDGGVQRLYEKWSELTAQVRRISAVGTESATEAAQDAAEQAPPLLRRQADSQKGGTVSAGFSHLKTDGIAGWRTRQSMAEISRFFERDARRYGGN